MITLLYKHLLHVVEEVLLGEGPPSFLAKSAIEDGHYFVTDAALEVLFRVCFKVSLCLVCLPLMYKEFIGLLFYLAILLPQAGPSAVQVMVHWRGACGCA